MATFEFSELKFDEFNCLADEILYIEGQMLYEGAKVIADAVHAQINRIPGDCFLNGKERQELKDHLVIAKHQREGDSVYTFVDWAGYNKKISKHYPKGEPVRMIARSICAGSSIRNNKYNFVDKALRSAEQAAYEQMQKTFDEEISKIVDKK